ncbi:MAG: helix-turn-helix transcriptional regulator [Ruminococcaceae bacterium]|nr:helix-turn-helix transcriptional regulator [Oscillospiraceae bacterium]
MTNRAFANNLLRQREALGLSQEDFALSIGVSAEEFAAWERGDAMPPLDVAGRIASKCGISLDELTESHYQPKMRFGSEDGVSESEKQREWAEYEAAADRRYTIGRRIMLAVLITEIISLVISFFFQNILVSVFIIIMLVCLWRGQNWARYVFAGLCAFAGIMNFIRLPAAADFLPALIISIAIIAYQLIVAALVLWNPCVDEFLSEQNSR